MWLRTKRDRPPVQRPGGGGGEPGREIIRNHWNDHLRLRIAKPNVEFNHLRSIARKHETGVKKSVIGLSLGGKTGQHWIHDLAHDARLHRSVEEGTRRERSHAASIRSLIAVEDSLVILRRHERRRTRAVTDGEEGDLRSIETLFEHDPRAGAAELLVFHCRANGEIRLGAMRC